MGDRTDIFLSDRPCLEDLRFLEEIGGLDRRCDRHLEGGDRTDIFLSDRTIYLEGDRTSKGGSSDLEVNILRLEWSDRFSKFRALKLSSSDRFSKYINCFDSVRIERHFYSS